MPAAGNPHPRWPTNGLRLAFLLPLLSVLSGVCFVAVPVTAGTLRLRAPQKAARNTIPDPAEDTIPPVALWINGLDLPASFVELPIDRFLTTWPDTWHPRGFTVLSWRAVTYPFFSLPFWWFAGLGWDALLKRRRLPWPVLLLGSIFCLLSTLGAIVLTRGRNDPYEAPGVDLPVVIGAYLWASLLVAFPLAWLLRRHVHSTPPGEHSAG